MVNMADREIFRENLNFYLKDQKKKQKDLAEYVGAKTTTVSGWTRGVSYPRADAMEKIAKFFDVPTSRLVGDRNGNAYSDARIVVRDSDLFMKIIDELNPDEYDMVLKAFNDAEKRLRERGEL
jgi:transcriptional regulator with XRE-family HTH domain